MPRESSPPIVRFDGRSPAPAPARSQVMVAVLLEGPVFVWMLPLVAVGTAALMRLLRRYLRIPAVVVLVTWLAVGLFDMLFERIGIAGGLLAYHQLGGPALHAGQPDQWPIYEGIAIGLAWALPGM